MMAKDRDALICDLAETYGIFDIKALPVSLLATLSVGLRENSRIKKKMAGVNLDIREQLLALAVDHMGALRWMLSKDGRTGANRPESVFEALMGTEPKEKESQIMSFRTPEEYESAWLRITGVSHG